MKPVSYAKTKMACYLGYVTQAISVNLPPLLYLTFQKEFSVTLSQLGLLMTVMFVVQIVVDLLAARYGKNLSYRRSGVIAFTLATLGLVLMCVLPSWMPNPYTGVLLSALLLSIGGGLIEVVISPVVDAIPQEGKAGEMSLLHSFYCWGIVGVVLLSTAFFAWVGIVYWRWLVLLWATVPLITAIMFALIPIPPKPEETEASVVGSGVLKSRWFWLLLALMAFSGATELAPAQWASFFAESGLQISKTLGDLLGPCAFALFQGLSRVVYARLTCRYNPRRMLLLCAVGCIAGYTVIVLSPWPFISLLGFCLCGLFVGPMWPGILSLSSERYPAGGTSMFALLALCGDMGCSVAPVMVGAVSDSLIAEGWFPSPAMRCGFAVCAIFPILLFVGLLWLKRQKFVK